MNWFRNKMSQTTNFALLTLETQVAYPTIELQLGRLRQFLPTNLLYDVAGQNFRISKDSLSSYFSSKETELVQRTKDPNDNRKLLNGINR